VLLTRPAGRVRSRWGRVLLVLAAGAAVWLAFAGAAGAATGAWALSKVELDPSGAGDPQGRAATAANGHIDYDSLDPPQTEFDVDFNPPPKALTPGSLYTFTVYVRGRITGGTDTQGFRTADAILLVNDRWDGRTAVGVGQNCNDPIGAAPISCTPPASASGPFKVSVPSSGTEFSFGVGMLNCGGCYVRYSYVFKSGASAGGSTGGGTKPAAAKRIEQTTEYRDFFGLRDPGRSSWLSWIDGQCRAMPERAAAFRGATHKVVIPGEGTLGKHSPNLLYPSNDLFLLLAQSDPPSALVAGGNVYAKVTRVFERKLRQEILRVRGQLLPADVLEMALRVTGGRYPLAVLTAHNLLKNATVIGRETIKQAQRSRKLFERDPARFLKQLRPQVALVRKLASLRANPRKPADKMGPWYHTFAVLSAGALVSPSVASVIVLAEHGAKLAKLFQSEGGFNKEKALIDACMAGAAADPKLRKLSR
jgi:hypothetical protein